MTSSLKALREPRGRPAGLPTRRSAGLVFRGAGARVRGGRASSASIAANSFSMTRVDGAPSVSFRRIVSASSSRTSS